MLTRIAVVSVPGFEVERIRLAFKNPMRFTVREFLSMQAVVDSLATFAPQVLIFRIPAFEEKHIVALEKARRRFAGVSILAVTKAITPSVRAAAASSGHRLFEEPREVEDLSATVEKLQRGDHSSCRLHARTTRTGGVRLIDQRGLVFRGRFVDFAQMGARITIVGRSAEGDILRARDAVEIRYESTDSLGRIHRLAAKVVWSESNSYWLGSSEQTLAVRFIAQL